MDNITFIFSLLEILAPYFVALVLWLCVRRVCRTIDRTGRNVVQALSEIEMNTRGKI